MYSYVFFIPFRSLIPSATCYYFLFHGSYFNIIIIRMLELNFNITYSILCIKHVWLIWEYEDRRIDDAQIKLLKIIINWKLFLTWIIYYF